MERPYLYPLKRPGFRPLYLEEPLSLFFLLFGKKLISPGRRPSSFDGKRSRDAEGPYLVIRADGGRPHPKSS